MRKINISRILKEGGLVTEKDFKYRDRLPLEMTKKYCKIRKKEINRCRAEYNKEVRNHIKKLKIGEYVYCIKAVTDNNYNTIMPGGNIVKIVEYDKNTPWYKYGVKVIKEIDLPLELQGKTFRTIMANGYKNGKISCIGGVMDFFNGDDGISQEYFDKIYWQPYTYLELINNE